MALARDLSDLPKAESAQVDGWAPDAEPRFAQVLVEQWAERNEADGPKARASATARFRHSDAGACSRKIAFAALNLPPSDPMDLPGVWNTSLGTEIHELWQAAIAELWPDAELEPKVTTIDGEGAGHIDAVITHDDGTVVAVELKTSGGYGFKAATGTARKGTPAEGPKHEHMIQAALNGIAVDADEVVIVYLAKECLSVNVAERFGVSELGRFLAEWSMDRDTYEPIARAEESRVRGILDLLDHGTLPARKIPAPDVPAGAVIVDPLRGRWEVHAVHEAPKGKGSLIDTGSYWGCAYCPHQTRCASTPAGRCSTEVLVELGGAA